MHRAFLNVGYLLSENQLQTHFAKFGSVTDTYLPKHTSGRNKGIGFVTFDSAEALERALLTPVHVINGVIVQVKALQAVKVASFGDLDELTDVSFPVHPAEQARRRSPR